RHITLHFTNFVLQNSDGVKIQAHDVLLSTLPWRWHKFNAKLKNGFDLSIPFNGSKTLFISTDATAHNHTDLNDDGDWQLIDLSLTNAKALWGADPFFSADKFSIEFQRPDASPKDSKNAGLSVEGSAEDMVLPLGLNEPFGSKLENIDLDLRIMGNVPDP